MAGPILYYVTYLALQLSAFQLFRLVYVFVTFIFGFLGACTYPTPHRRGGHPLFLPTYRFPLNYSTWSAKVSFILRLPFPFLCSSSSYYADLFLFTSSPYLLAHRFCACPCVFFCAPFLFRLTRMTLDSLQAARPSFPFSVRERWTHGLRTPGHECIKNIVTN